MTCRDVRRLLSYYFEGELDGKLRGAIEAHVVECQSCLEAFHQHSVAAGMDLVTAMNQELWQVLREKVLRK